jgi:hypothetical protein
MNAEIQTAEQPLREQIDRAQQKLGGLERTLRDVDGELSGLATQREQYDLLEGVCNSLDKLDDLGVARMFWGERVGDGEAAEHVRRARDRIGVFAEQIKTAEEKRRSIIEELKQEYEVLGILEDDLYEVQEQEEQRRQEWLIERDVGPFPIGRQLMPWASGGEEDQRFRKSLGIALLIAVVTGVVMQLVSLPAPEAMQIVEVPERLVQLIELEQRRAAPPPPVIEEPEPTPPEPEEQPPEPEPVLAEAAPTDAPKLEEPGEPAPAAPVAEEPPRARAQSAGILAFRESFSDIAGRKPAPRLGAQARIGNTGEGDVGPPERAMVTSLAPGSSGGINLAAFSRDLGGDGGGGGGAMAGVAVTRVASTIGGGPGGNGPGGNGAGDRRSGGGALAGRTDEEIQIVFDRYKAALYRLYNRELRNDPTLRGQMVLRLTIEPDGSVSMCALQSSDMNAPALASQVVERVKTFAFGAKDVPAITILYPIDFLPAA